MLKSSKPNTIKVGLTLKQQPKRNLEGNSSFLSPLLSSLSLSNIKFYLPKPLNLLKSLTFPVWSLSSLINLLKRLLFKRFIKKYEEKKNSNTLSTKLPVLRREKEYLYSLFCLFANWPLRILMFFIFLPIFLTNTNVTPNFLIV